LTGPAYGNKLATENRAVAPLLAGLFFGSLAIIAVVFALEHVATRRRCNSFHRVADELGLSYQGRGRPLEGTDVSAFPFLEHGPATMARNVLRGELHGCPVVIFELTRFGPSEIASRETTYAAFRAPYKLPILHMGAKHTLDRIREKTRKDAHREFDPRFVHEFFVFSSDPALHDFLTAEKMQGLLEHAHDYHMETSADWLLVYRHGGRVPARRLRQFLEETSEIAAVMLHSQRVAA
jgi:hypothetical protein